MHSFSFPELSQIPCTGQPIVYASTKQSIHHTEGVDSLAFRVHRSISVSEFCDTSMELALAVLGLCIAFLYLVVLVDRDQNS